MMTNRKIIWTFRFRSLKDIDCIIWFCVIYNLFDVYLIDMMKDCQGKITIQPTAPSNQYWTRLNIYIKITSQNINIIILLWCWQRVWSVQPFQAKYWIQCTLSWSSHHSDFGVQQNLSRNRYIDISTYLNFMRMHATKSYIKTICLKLSEKGLKTSYKCFQYVS